MKKNSIIKDGRKLFIVILFIAIFTSIPIIYSATTRASYELIVENEVNVKEGELFDLEVKSNNIGDLELEEDTETLNTDDTEDKTIKEKIYLKLDEKVVINESGLVENNIDYIYDSEENILEIESQITEEGLKIPLKAVDSGDVSIELYLEDEKIDEELITVEKREEIAEESASIPERGGRSTVVARDVNTWAEFHAAFIDKTVTQINIMSNFASTSSTNLYYMNGYRRPVGTNITINGNGHTVDFKGLIYSFQSTTTANYNSLTIKDIDMQGQSWYGPFLIEGNANTGASIIYENVSYEGAQMTAAFIADVYIKGIVNSKSVSSYISKIDGTKRNTDAGNQQNLEVSNVIFTTNSIYNGYGENGPLMYLRNGGSAILEENAVVNLERDGDTGEHAYVTLYLQGNVDLEKNSKLNIKTRDGSKAGGISIAGSGKYIRVKEGAELNVNTNGAVSSNGGINVGDGAILDVEPGGKTDINMSNMGTSAFNGLYMGTGAIVNVKDDGLLNVTTTGSGIGITTAGSSKLNINKRAKLNVKLGNSAATGRSGIVTGTSSSLMIYEDGLLDVEVDGAGTGIKVGGTSTFNVEGKGKMNVNLKNTKSYTTPALDAAANTSIVVKKDGIVDIKSDGTASKRLVDIAAGTNSNFKFSDAKRINLEFTEVPNSASKLIYMPYGYLSIDIQSAKVWDKNSISVDELTPTKSWIPIWTANGVKTVEYDASGNTKKVSASSVSQTLATDFNTNFKTENYRKLLFEGIPDVQVTIDPLSTSRQASNSHTITGKTNPGAYVRFSGDPAIAQGTIASPLDSEKNDPTKSYHAIADSNGNYSYSLPSGTYFTDGSIVEVYSYLNGKDATNSTVVEKYIYIPDPNLRKAVNKELTGTELTMPMYFKVAEIESLTKLMYSGQGLADSNKIVDLTGLEYAINITSIDFRSNKIVDLTPISKSDKLKTLILQYNKITNIPDMKEMTGLENLDLMSTGTVDVTNISKAPNLKDLNLGMNNLTDISALSSLITLNKFTAKNNQIVDISALKNISTLNYLDLGFNKIVDISPIESLLNLQSLDFTSNNISNIKPLENLTNLKSLYLGQNEISNIRYLDKLINLNSLNIYKNEVEDISYLHNKTELTYLVANFNKIKDVTPLKNLNKLNYLAVVGNQITDISSLDSIIGNITTFFAAGQIVDLGTVKINGNKLTLDNPTKTIEGGVPLTTISDGGKYDLVNNTIEWINLGSTQLRSFTFEDSKRDFDGTVKLIVSRVEIMSPDNPDSLNINPSPEGIVDFNHDLKLAINYIEPLDFGTAEIEAGNMNIEAVTKSPYIQISDLRDVSSGWKLNVSGTSLKEKGGGIIDGVNIKMKDGTEKSSPTGNLNSPIITPDIVIPLGGSSSTAIQASNGKGAGTWLGIWDTKNKTNEKVTMEVPGKKARVGSYETTITWVLMDTP